MSPDAEKVLQTALALPAGEQVRLIEALIAALDQADPQPLDDAWMTEIQRRSAEYDAGKVTPVPWSMVRTSLGGTPGVFEGRGLHPQGRGARPRPSLRSGRATPRALYLIDLLSRTSTCTPRTPSPA